MKVDDLFRAARCQKATSGAETVSLHPEMSLYLSQERCAKHVNLEAKVVLCELSKPFSTHISKNVTKQNPVVFLPTPREELAAR